MQRFRKMAACSLFRYDVGVLLHVKYCKRSSEGLGCWMLSGLVAGNERKGFLPHRITGWGCGRCRWFCVHATLYLLMCRVLYFVATEILLCNYRRELLQECRGEDASSPSDPPRVAE